MGAVGAVSAPLAADRAAHLATVANQRGLVQGAASNLRDQRNHIGPDRLMRTGVGPAMADDFKAAVGKPNRIGPVMGQDLSTLGPLHARHWTGGASDEEEKRNDTHSASYAAVMLGGQEGGAPMPGGKGALCGLSSEPYSPAASRWRGSALSGIHPR